MLPASNNKIETYEDVDMTQNMDKDLATAWLAMKKFCLLVNLGTQTERFIRLEIIYETMIAVFYRVLDMSFAKGSMDDSARQGLLCFCYHVFLQWQDIRPSYHHFPAAYRSCILDFERVDGGSSRYMLWLLMTGATSIFNVPNEDWLRERLRKYASRCEVKTWKDMQEILKSFMWIALLDDQPGKRIFDFINLAEKR